MQGIRHHLIDVLDPAQDFSAGDFYTLARAAADDILRVCVVFSYILVLPSLYGRGVKASCGCKGIQFCGVGQSRGGRGLAVGLMPAGVLDALPTQPYQTQTERQDAHRGGRHRPLPPLVCTGKAKHATL